MKSKGVFGLVTLFALFFSSSLSEAKNKWQINDKEYEVDTVVYKHKVGPGTTFAKYNLPGFPLLVSVIEMDLGNKYVDFETCKGGDKGVCEEQPTSMYSRNDRPGHDMIAATNGDFYFYQNPVENGIPRSGQFKKNECITNPVGRAAFVLTDERKPYIDHVDFSGTVKSGEITTRLHTVNMQRLEWENTNGNQLNLYTNAYGTETENCSGGTKIIISPKEGTFFWSANKDIVAKIDNIVDGTGVTQIPEGKAVLWGRGTSEEFLKTLAVGGEITLNLTTNLRLTPGVIKDFKELMGGSNNILLKDGAKVDDSPDRQPRTCMGYSKDEKTVYYVIFDGRSGKSAGTTFGECGEIFRALGASDAVNLDGGGSSCMIVNGDIVNTPSDGTVRPVGNGCLIVSNAPVDDEIGEIGFAPRPFNINAFAKFRPKVYGYNKYGLLKSRDMENVSFSCDPNIGKIVDGYFIASPNPGVGNITATYSGKTVSQKVYILPTEISIRLQTVVLDKTNPYEIELIGTNGVYIDKLDPSAFAWRSADENICVVDNGIIRAINNGNTEVIGTVNGKEYRLNVKVMTAASNVEPIYPNLDISKFAFASAGVNNKNITKLENGIKLDFTGASNRSPYFKMSYTNEILGLPNVVRLRFNPGIVPIKNVTFTLTTEKLGNVTKSFDFTGNANELCTLDIPISELIDPNDRGSYPLSLISINFTFSAIKTGTQYSLEIPGIEVVYDNYSSVEWHNKDNKDEYIAYPNPISAGDMLSIDNITKDTFATLYNVAGSQVFKVKLISANGKSQISTSELQKGIYFIVIDSKTIKLIVK